MIMKKKISLYFFVLIYSANVFSQKAIVPTPQWRPVYHFTPLKNWTNDPNGLIYIKGVYHLYNQQNPFENKWGHMSWGHATSTDLVHWQHLPIAMAETIDKDTTWRFSGSAVLDKNNTSGFCKNANCIVAIYTADQPNLKKESQFVAYSNDGGKSFTNYAGNPVIDLHMKDFRDPNVFWFEKTKQWIMAVALPVEHKVRFYGSTDLKKWDELSDFGPEGYTGANWECPFLIQLPVDNDSANHKWILAVSAAGGEKGVYMQYFTGEFDGKSFVNDNAPRRELTLDFGDSFYAAIPWNNLPEHQKTFIGWMIPGPVETSPWKGQMSIPRELSLTKKAEGIRLVQKPAAIIKNNLAKLSKNKLQEIKQIDLNTNEIPISNPQFVKNNSYWIEAELENPRGATSGFKIAQKKTGTKINEEIEIGYDASKYQVYVNKSLSGDTTSTKDNTKQIIQLNGHSENVKLEILFDKSSLEIFVNDGEQVLTTYVYPAQDANGLSVFSKDGNASIKNIKIWDMSQANNTTMARQ